MDVNGDGRRDLVYFDRARSFVHHAKPDGTLGARERYVVSRRAGAAHPFLARWVSERFLDTLSIERRRVVLVRGDRLGASRETLLADAARHGARPVAPGAADADGDGDLDLFVSWSDGSITLHVNTGSRDRPELGAPQTVLPAADNRHDVALYPLDWNGDGRADVLASWKRIETAPSRPPVGLAPDEEKRLPELRKQLAGASLALRELNRSRPDMKPKALALRRRKRAALAARIGRLKQTLGELQAKTREQPGAQARHHEVALLLQRRRR